MFICLCHISQMVNDRTVGYKINKLVFCRQICHFGVLHQKLFEQRIGTFNENVVGIKHRHDSIGKGVMGMTTFKMLMADPRFDDIPLILETCRYRHRRAFYLLPDR